MSKHLGSARRGKKAEKNAGKMRKKRNYERSDVQADIIRHKTGVAGEIKANLS